MPSKIDFSDAEISSIIYSHVEENQNTSKIAKNFGCSHIVIKNILVENNVYQPIGTRKYFFDENYFENIDTPRKAYWLGLFFADGNVSKTVFKLGLKREDKYILQNLAVDVQWNGEIRDEFSKRSFGNQDEKTYLSSTISLCSKKFVSYLGNHGVLPNKTFRLSFPNIPKNLRRHFVRGIFDGDGMISITQNNFKTNFGFLANWSY